MDESELESSANKRRRGRGKIWNKEIVFNSLDEAEKFIVDEGCWTKTKINRSTAGEKYVYRCKETPRNSINQCQAGVYLLLHAETIQVTLFRSESEHNHSNSDVKRGIKTETKKIIQQLFDDGTTRPTAILYALENRGIELPSKAQLNSFLSTCREKTFSKGINFNQLEEWCTARLELPQDIDKPFVVTRKYLSRSQIVHQENVNFFITTKSLLINCVNSDLIQVDSINKLLWFDYPILIVGTTDRAKVFHPFGIGICHGETQEDFEFLFNSIKKSIQEISEKKYEPKYLLADPNDDITKGFTNIFGPPQRRLICYSHVIKSVETFMRSMELDSSIREQIKKDLSIIQSSESDQIFQIGINLFQQKWTEDLSRGVDDFLKYFDYNWTSENKFWYEGATSFGYPSTNKGIKEINEDIKKKFMFRQRLPLEMFLTLLEHQLIPCWSFERNSNLIHPNQKLFTKTPLITNQLLKQGYQWVCSCVHMFPYQDQDGNGEDDGDKSVKTFFIPSSKTIESQEFISDQNEHFDNFKSIWGQWKSFDVFVEHRSSYCMIKISNNITTPSGVNCNCPVFLKSYQCEHSIGICFRLGLLDVPNSCKDFVVGQKRKRGRPPKVKIALVYQ